MKILVLGAGSFAVLVARCVPPEDLAGFVVNDEYHHSGDTLMGRWVYSASNALRAHDPGKVRIVSGIVSPKREGLVERLSERFRSVAVVHAQALVDARAEVRPGAFVNGGAQLDYIALVCDHAIINRGASLGHNVVVGRCATVGPGAVLCGDVTVGPGAFVGANATVLEGRVVGPGAVVGAGAVVYHDVVPGTTVMGVPAREVEK